ncbi:DegT/DnrJ/EryC1/StrS family aminotransferase [Nonomuraea sp. NPDC050786]|uniref:DegT/DnrJ/EryC1/StrS family aminotransferase n=1 Tax=Nonomuraea sp. NPDC050786 TaxID=3154840 RepID=UPI0033E6DFF3
MAEADGRTLGDEEVAAAEWVIRSGMLNSVRETEARALEREIARVYGTRHAVACSSGTTALHLSVVAAAPDPADEIITTPITDFGTVAPSWRRTPFLSSRTWMRPIRRSRRASRPSWGRTPA